MHASLLRPGLDTLLLGVPLLCLLFAGYFHLDQIAAAPKSGKQLRRRGSRTSLVHDPAGRAFMTAPDGRPWGRSVPSR
jgi:hypothetical protein